MRKQKSIGNKGFSLVELIIVIAIMAILVGVLAPQLLKYVEKTRVSADTQFADTVKTAITTAMLDPTNMENSSYQNDISALGAIAGVDLTAIGSSLMPAVKETLGIDSSSSLTSSWVSSNLKSKGASSISVRLIGSNQVEVTVNGSHADADSGSAIVVK